VAPIRTRAERDPGLCDERGMGKLWRQALWTSGIERRSVSRIECGGVGEGICEEER